MIFLYETNHIYLNDSNDNMIAEVTFPAINSNLVNINHTFVDASLRGQGVAGKLMKAVVDQLRAEGKKAYCSCSYAIQWAAKHPECNDVLTTQISTGQ